MSKAARVKGHGLERETVIQLKAYGWQASTSRYSNRELDDLKVDIDTDAPFNIQCKAVERLSMPVHQLLFKDMPTDKTPVVFHKRNNKGTVVSMRLSDFFKLLIVKKD